MKPAQSRHISIIGTSIGSRDLPTKGERWGLAWHSHKGFDRLFEMHDWRYYRQNQRDYGDYSRITMLPKMAKRYGAVAYPLAQVRVLMGGRNYFTSTVAYMLALAIHEQASEITINGVDLVEDEEYVNQRPCMEFLVGLAIGRGIKVNIPKGSALCRHSFVYGQERPKEYGELNGQTGEVLGYLNNQISLCADHIEGEAARGIDCIRLRGTLDAFRATRDAIKQGTRGADMSRLGQIQ